MGRTGQKRKTIQVTEAEDWCFLCKDGGDLILCDHWDCSKVYHSDCVGKEDSVLETEERWNCDRHSCYICHSPPKLHCFCCPNSVCRNCIHVAEFAHVRGKNGFCTECLSIILLAEENSKFDSDGEEVDFENRDTYECLFKEYWEILKEKEGLTLDDVYAADKKLKKGETFKSSFSSQRFGDSKEEILYIPSDSDIDNTERDEPIGKKTSSKMKEFIGWGSKPLIEFLASIGIDSAKERTQYELESIFLKYIQERKLVHPEKKRKVICDEKLYAVFRKKTLNKHRIYDHLEDHFAENFNHSEDEGHNGNKNCSAVKGTNTEEYKKLRLLRCNKQPQKKNLCVNIQRGRFASIIADNIKLMYLRRSLVDELLKHPESFEDKVVGSFVKIKTDNRNSYKLLPVAGVKKSSTGEINGEILLQFCNMEAELPISMLSDSDFTEEECADLQERVNNGLIERPTVAEIEKKARMLREDIIKQWMERELVMLQNRIDYANEKGRRGELFKYMEQRELLKKPSEQERLLKHVPAVMADLLELEPASADSLDSNGPGRVSSPLLILE